LDDPRKNWLGRNAANESCRPRLVGAGADRFGPRGFGYRPKFPRWARRGSRLWWALHLQVGGSKTSQRNTRRRGIRGSRMSSGSGPVRRVSAHAGCGAAAPHGQGMGRCLRTLLLLAGGRGPATWRPLGGRPGLAGGTVGRAGRSPPPRPAGAGFYTGGPRKPLRAFYQGGLGEVFVIPCFRICGWHRRGATPRMCSRWKTAASKRLGLAGRLPRCGPGRGCWPATEMRSTTWRYIPHRHRVVGRRQKAAKENASRVMLGE